MKKQASSQKKNVFRRFIERAKVVLKQHVWWHVALFLIGVLSTLSILLTLFTPIGESIKPLTVTSDWSVDSTDFIPALASLVHAPTGQGGSIEIINNGDAFMASLLESIANAKHSIVFTNYIWENGSMSDTIFAALTAKQREGVSVRVLLDANGGKNVSKENIAMLTDAGGKVASFRPAVIGKLTRFHLRNHRRTIVMDGTIGYTGGIGIADRWLRDARNPDEWRDMMFKVTGPMAQTLQSTFADLWAGTTGEVLTGSDFYPLSAAEQTKGPVFIQFPSSPLKDINPLSHFISLSLLSAHKSILIATPYFIPDKTMQAALIQKAHEGVDIEIILPNKLTDTESVRLASQSFYTKMLKAGIKIYEYQPTFIHSKYMVIDGTWSIVGSANLDNRSLELNQENILGILDPSFGKEMTDTFTEDKSHTTEITLDVWQHRSIFHRILETLAHAFVQQF